MLNLKHIKQKVTQDLHEHELMQACINICEYVENKQPSQLQHIDFRTLYIASSLDDQTNLFKALQYLTGVRAHLFDVAYELFYNDFPTQIDKSYLDEANRDGIFCHPDTGEEIDNYKDLVEMYFKISPELKEL